jgi:homoserine kinase
VAASVVTGADVDPERLLAEGFEFEGHGDNLAAALAGGACLTWGTRIARIADAPPALAIVLVPAGTVSTTTAREALPEHVLHDDAAFSAARAEPLGAALATGSEELFSEALADRLHEPHRAANAPLLEAVREQLPAEALGATISGSGPSIVVWARLNSGPSCVVELTARYPDVAILPLPASPKGAHAL